VVVLQLGGWPWGLLRLTVKSYEMLHLSSDLDSLAQGRGQWQVLVNTVMNLMMFRKGRAGNFRVA
jgi:hypothetical protein